MTGKADRPTIGDLLRLDILSRDDLQAAVDAYIADPGPAWREIANGIGLDIKAAIDADPHTRQMMTWAGVSRMARELALRTAILIAKPERPSQAAMPRSGDVAWLVRPDGPHPGRRLALAG
ncbi:hypothetical protein [Methylobacterium sp. ID0610]|uniref:hypothetical protein n=1 Tax=Methylobacterium carpenticola TaxID=3344827 RepID=UPI00368AFCF6